MRCVPRIVFVVIGVGLAAACGGGTASSPDGGADVSAGGSSSGGSGSGGTMGGSSSSSSGGGSADAGAFVIDSGTPGTGPLVGCAMAGTCNPPQACCPGGGRNGGDVCATVAACASGGGNVYTCTGQANCATGTVCCLTIGARGAPDVATCQTTCRTGGNNGPFQVCQTNMECSNGQRCRNVGAADLTVCQNPPPPMMDAGGPRPDAGADARADGAGNDGAGSVDAGTPDTGSDAPADSGVD